VGAWYFHDLDCHSQRQRRHVRPRAGCGLTISIRAITAIRSKKAHTHKSDGTGLCWHEWQKKAMVREMQLTDWGEGR
jgi:hypothetical protein